MKKIAIIGAGASGLAAAVAAGEAAARGGKNVQVHVFEASDRVGRPILATGNGRCNFTNARIDADVYRNSPFVADALSAFEAAFPKGTHPNGVAAFFADRGMLYREEGEGRMYPLANKASVVLDTLRSRMAALGTQVHLEAPVASIEAPRDGSAHFTMRMADGAFERADGIILACGGKVAKAMLPDGFAFAEPQPVLCSIATDTTYIRELDNIRAKAVLSLVRGSGEWVREAGEVMFRKYGISGICAFNLSRFAMAGDFLSVDFLPFVAERDAQSFADERLRMLEPLCANGVTGADFLEGMVLPRVADALLKYAGVEPSSPANDSNTYKLMVALKDFRAQVKGPGDVEHAQVQRGGFDVSAFDAETFEAKEMPGLYVVGEALDVDAPCGGFNLHWAFASGLMAGRSCIG